MRPETRTWRRIPRRTLLVTALLLTAVLGGTLARAEAKDSKLPLLYKGNGYKLKPGLMWGWDPDGLGKPIRYLGKIHISDPAGSAVNWTTWNYKQAVGKGLARSSGCPMGGEGGECELGYPWNGTHLKVVAWRPISGHFTRMKIYTPISQKSDRYYELYLSFRAPVVPDKKVSWRIVSTSRR